MRLISLIVICLTSLGFYGFADANSFEGYLKAGEIELYAKYEKAADPKAPTVMLLNGLTYSTRQWESFAQVLRSRGISVLRYDMFGMGNTLLRYGPVLSVIPYQFQVETLKALLEKLKIASPYNLVGLSYGGAIATAFGAEFPELTGRLFLMAPYTRPLEEQDKWIKSQIWQNRQMFPFNPASDDELYDYFLRQIIYTTYPAAEPISVENPLKLEGIFRLVQGVRKWDSKKAVKRLPEGSVYLMIAEKDQYIKRSVMDEFWTWVPDLAKAEIGLVPNSEHKIPEAAPKFSANWVADRVLKRTNVR